MKRSFLALLALISLAAGLILPVIALGQDLEKEQFNASGTFKGIAAPGVLQMASGEGDMWLVKVEAKPQDITFSGTAEKSFLRTGMFVEFRAAVSKRGTIAEPVAMLTVFTPSDGRPPGILPDGDLGGGGNGLFGEEKKEEPKERKAAAKPKADDTVYRVAGAISKIGRGGDITVSAGGAQVKANLAEECKISVDLNDLSFISAGDKVTVGGWFYKVRPLERVVNKVEVIAANPLTDGSKKKPAKAAKPEKGAKGAKGEKGDKPADEEKKDDKATGEKEPDKPEPDKPEPKKDD